MSSAIGHGLWTTSNQGQESDHRLLNAVKKAPERLSNESHFSKADVYFKYHKKNFSDIIDVLTENDTILEKDLTEIKELLINGPTILIILKQYKEAIA